MNTFDKEAWLKLNGTYNVPWFNTTPHITGQWTSHGGMLFNSYDIRPIDDIFTKVRNELYDRVNLLEDGSPFAWWNA